MFTDLQNETNFRGQSPTPNEDIILIVLRRRRQSSLGVGGQSLNFSVNFGFVS